MMMLLTPLYSLSQDRGRYYTYEQRLVIANHNIERLQCLESSIHRDTIIVNLRSICESQELILDQKSSEISSYILLHEDLAMEVSSLEDQVVIKDAKIKKYRRRGGAKLLIIAIETIIIVLICL